MTQESGTPLDFYGRIQKMIEDAVAKVARSGMLRNSSISDGGLTVRGGFFRLIGKLTDTFDLFYLGPVGGVLGDGSVQQWWRVKRADGSTVLRLWDAFPGVDGTLNQALSWIDRSGNTVFSDDTDSGVGHARPWLSGTLTAARYQDFRYTVTDTDWVTVADQRVNKQQPRLEVSARASMDTSGATGQMRVLVDGVQLGAVTDESFAITTRYFGPALIAGVYGEDVVVELQAKVTSGPGALRIEPKFWRGRQS